MYERMLVPLIFQPYAEDLAQRVQAFAPRRLLETAAGTGVVTRALAARLGADTQIVATDLNQPMLDHAMTKQPSGASVEWKQADALALPFPDESFDVVACQFGVMFFPDKLKGFGEARRVLRPGGRFIFNVWDRIEANDFADVIAQALASLIPADPPRFMARTPHGHHDTDKLRQELSAAGFADISVDAVDAVSKAANPLDPAIAYCQGTPWRNEIEARQVSLEEATRHAAEALAQRFGTGAVAGRIRAFVISARR